MSRHLNLHNIHERYMQGIMMPKRYCCSVTSKAGKATIRNEQTSKSVLHALLKWNGTYASDLKDLNIFEYLN